MLNKLKSLFTTAGVAEEDSENKLRVSVAALLVEMARADFDQSDEENAHIAELLAAHFTIPKTAALDLLAEAEHASDDAVSLYDFIRALQTTLSAEERLQVIEMLWQVALSDKHLDKYEDSLVRKIAELMYVPESAVLRIKYSLIGS